MTAVATQKPVKLDASVPQKVSYCVPGWMRDLQVAENLKRPGIGRIQTDHALKDEPAAIVCYGPSLNDTWQKVRDFPNIFSCSGAHKFLIERGIIPRWHVEVDPRPHKIELLGPPHPDVEYLLASACSPKLLDHLAGFSVKLWHVFPGNDQFSTPRGEWQITGGCGVGLRAMTLARFFGYRRLHIFGMDGCEGKTGKHAAEHPMQAKEAYPVEFGGQTYYTTPAFLEAARGTFHELDVLKDVSAMFYGDGLVQAMAREYERKTVMGETQIAFNFPELISAELRDLNIRLHQDAPYYGAGGGKYASIILDLCKKMGYESVLDYGCGKSQLSAALPFPIWEYDPAIPGKDGPPRSADLVVCTDVLEHVEPGKLDYVLDDLRRCAKKMVYLVIHTGPARKTYADGRNTHLIQESPDWWNKHLRRFFAVGKFLKRNEEYHIALGVKDKGGAPAAQELVQIPDVFDKLSHKLVLEDWIKRNNWTRGAEIGVFHGHTYFHLIKHCPTLTLYGVDLWEEQPEKDALFDQGGRSYKFFELPKWGKQIRQRVAREYPDRAILIQADSVAAATQVPDASLDFVFIDGDHTEEGVRRDILAWRPKVRPGGALAGHDIEMPSVRRAVESLCAGYKLYKQQVWGLVL